MTVIERGERSHELSETDSTLNIQRELTLSVPGISCKVWSWRSWRPRWTWRSRLPFIASTWLTRWARAAGGANDGVAFRTLMGQRWGGFFYSEFSEHEVTT